MIDRNENQSKLDSLKDGGTDEMIDEICSKVPNASRDFILELLVSCGANVKDVLSLLGVSSEGDHRESHQNDIGTSGASSSSGCGTDGGMEGNKYSLDPSQDSKLVVAGKDLINNMKDSEVVEEKTHKETIIPMERNKYSLDSSQDSKLVVEEAKDLINMKDIEVVEDKNHKEIIIPTPHHSLQTTLKRYFTSDSSDRERKRSETIQKQVIGDDWQASDQSDEESPKSSEISTSTDGLPISNVKFIPPPSGILHLYDPETIEQLLPCTFHLNVFPKKLANDLLSFFVTESEHWTTRKFYLFDRLVESPHSSAMYSSNKELLEKQDATYQGRVVSGVRPFNNLLVEAGEIVTRIVNNEINRRGRTSLQYKGDWYSDVVVTNCYDGGQQSVGYHSDQLTHLGPACVIASISLGVTREFRLAKRWSPAAKREQQNLDDTKFSIHVNHNSMVIMHAGAQEAYKHCVMPSKKPLTPHPISNLKRINLTYRMFLPEYKTENLPVCSCNKPMILRTAKTEWKTDSKLPTYKYIWQCSAEYSTNKGCGKIIYLDWVP